MVKIPVKKSFCVCRRRQTIFFVFLTVRLLETVLIHGIIVKNNRWLSVKTTYGLVKSTNSRCIFPQNFCKMQVYQTKMPFGQIENDGFPSGGNLRETFGQRFQRMRKNANLTQEDVATKLNITAQAVSKWENDVSAPDISVLVELSDILGVSLDELLGKERETRVQMSPDKKSIDKMVLKIKVISNDGDKVNVNLPLVIVKSLVTSGAEMPKFNGSDVLSNVDFNQLFALVEQGVVGKIVDVQSSDGDTVEIWVE